MFSVSKSQVCVTASGIILFQLLWSLKTWFCLSALTDNSKVMKSDSYMQFKLTWNSLS